MKEALILAKDGAKHFIVDNSNKIWVAGASVAALVSTYLLGKTRGETHVDVYLTSKDEDGNFTVRELPEVK